MKQTLLFWAFLLVATSCYPQSTSVLTKTNYYRIDDQLTKEEDWHSRGKKVVIQYLTNTQDNPDSQVWHLSVLEKTGLDCTIKANGLYQSGTLKGVLTRDEDDCMSIEFKDRQGNVVLSRQFDNEGGRVDTYYVYDDYGLLRAVLPARISISLVKGDVDADRINQYAYLYQYDTRDRLVAKKLPGVEWKTMEYDDKDRLVSEQDGVQRKDGEKTFHLYDVHGRECLIGIATAEADLKNSTVFYDGENEFTNGYQCSASANSGIIAVLKAYYYDNYGFAKGCNLPIDRLNISGSNTYQGKLVGMKALRLKKDFFPFEYDTYIYSYDYRGLATGTLKSNHLAGYNLEQISYNFNGQPLKRYVECAPFYGSAKFQYEYRYDLHGRLRRENVVVNFREHLTIANNQYDELGRLVNDSRTGDAALNTTYNYNVRSQLTGISSPIFSEKLYYNSNPYESKVSYNGNISAHSWEIAPYQEGYSYEYDKLSRLTKAKYYSGETPTNRYTSSYDYDSMGNILSLQRNRLLDNGQWGLGDDIAYEYIGNQLYKADNHAAQTSYASHVFFSDNVDLETEYAYDENGNMTKNLNKDIDSISYNEIGMPKCICFKGGGKTEYIYSATGEKLQVKHTPSIGDKAIITNYCGEAVFDDINLETVQFDGGYMSYKHTSAPVFYHYVKDYQGSNRVIYNAKNDEVIQRISYYPFGSILNTDQDVDFQRYFYNGKELESLQGLFLYDYGARFYDGIRFTTMDPLSEKYYSISPYAYCLNNPIRFIDKNGERPTAYEAALMAQYVYRDKDSYKQCLEELSSLGWTLSNYNTSIQKNYTGVLQNGLQTELFERKVGGKIEYAYIYAGTNSIQDAAEDIAQVFGVSPQYATAISNAKVLSEELKGKELTFVGHSLGGGEAAAASMATDRAAITFNPASVSKLTKFFNNLSSTNKIVNYRTSGVKFGAVYVGGDPINNLQDNLHMHAPGSTVMLPIGIKNPLDSHSIGTIVKYLKKQNR